MNFKKVLPWVLGGVITISVWGGGPLAVVGSAAEHTHEHTQQGMSKDAQQTAGQTDPKMMQDGKHMMDPELMKQHISMLQQPGMQDMVKEMLAKPEMQTTLKAMMQTDGQFHKMMLDLVNSVEMTEEHDHDLKPAAVPTAPMVNAMEQHQHH